MSKSDTTHFQFSLSNVELEISGERKFVERMYRRIMRDVEEARHSQVLPDTQEMPTLHARMNKIEDSSEAPVLWVHRCSEMMHKIYMSSPKAIARAEILRSLDANQLNVVFVQDELVTLVLPNAERGHTLWAELTEAGRRRIASANPADAPAED